MSNETIEKPDIFLSNASLNELRQIASDLIYRHKAGKEMLSIKDVSGNSGAKTFVCSSQKGPKCIIKVKVSKHYQESRTIIFKQV